ncbi:hypothetical protein J6590_090128, partial [Homalodisca vitripennis]
MGAERIFPAIRQKHADLVLPLLLDESLVLCHHRSCHHRSHPPNDTTENSIILAGSQRLRMSVDSKVESNIKVQKGR